MRVLLFIPLLGFAGCLSTSTRTVPERKMTSEEALGMFFLMTALSGKAGPTDFLSTVYPLRSQLVTFAVIGFHRDRGHWPTTAEELLSYVGSSQANPPLPEDAVAGFVASKSADGGLVYSTLEDRQRGRDFAISNTYKVTFPVPSYPFASSASSQTIPARGSTMSFDWGQAIAQALSQLARQK